MRTDEQTISAAVLAALRAGDGPALVDGPSGIALDGATVAGRIEGVAGGLTARGLGPGDVVALWLPNVPPWLGTALGAMHAGCAVTGIGPAAAPREAADQMRRCGARLLVAPRSRAAEAEAAAAAAGVADVLLLGSPGAPGTFEGLLAAEPLAVGRGRRHDVALLPCSSGTTGLPKAVELTHGNLLAATADAIAGLALTEDDVVLALAPFAHIMGFLVSGVAPLCAGATLVTLPRFDPDAFLGLAEEHRASVLVVPPPVLGLLARHPGVDLRDLGAVRLVVSGGAHAPAALQEAVARRLGVEVGQGYGLTETTGTVATPVAGRATPAGTAGRVVDGMETRLVDPVSGGQVAPGGTGELWVRGPSVMRGYRGDEVATRAVLDEEGWLRTGDLCRIDADGVLRVVDRLKELLKVDAHQVAPAELELLLRAHPAVADAAVLGRPDPRHGEVPVALVVPAGPGLDVDELLEDVHARVAPYKRLRAVHLVDDLPRTPAGKLLRRRLREPAVV